MQDAPIANTLEFAKSEGLDHHAVVGSLKSLAADNYVVMEAEDHESWKLSEEGALAADQGSPEARVFSMVRLPASPPPVGSFLFSSTCVNMCAASSLHTYPQTHTAPFAAPHPSHSHTPVPIHLAACLWHCGCRHSR